MTKDDQIMVMLEAFDLVRECLRLDFLIEELKADIGKADYYDYAERSAKAWLVKELGGEDMTVPLDSPVNSPGIPAVAGATVLLPGWLTHLGQPALTTAASQQGTPPAPGNHGKTVISPSRSRRRFQRRFLFGKT
jgi:hypothetical protein